MSTLILERKEKVYVKNKAGFFCLFVWLLFLFIFGCCCCYFAVVVF